LGPKPGNMSQNGQKTTYDVTHKKSTTSTNYYFFIVDYKTSESFEGLNSSLA